ncbi:ATP-binding cassette domain-containing protein [Xanthomonas sp. NCPPB 2632]|uniref:ATP-binding cassette domain-containing protein n=1 Tax=Xanthomonas sp. NCPPB 2632 TaxID=3240912 RepID=UPI0035135C0B
MLVPGLHLLVGPNGAGKTTLLNAIAGTIPCVSGAMRLDGRPLRHMQGEVALAPGTPPDIPWMRSGLLLDFVTSLYPATKRDDAYRDEVVGRLGINGLLDTPMGSLSAGSAKKVMLAATLMTAAKVMLFDEPINEIDAASMTQFLALLDAYKASRVVIVSTHHLAQLRPMASGVISLGG